MEQGKIYNNGSMQLMFLENIKGYNVFYRLNDNTYVITNYIVSIDSKNNCISWLQGHYMISIVSVYEYINEKIGGLNNE